MPVVRKTSRPTQRRAQAVVRKYQRYMPRMQVARSLPVSTAMAIESTVQRAINRETEQKYVDTELVSVSTNVPNTFNNNSMIFLVNGVQQGVGQFNRDGNKITLQSLKADLMLSHTYSQDPGAAAVLTANAVRVVVIWDTEGGGNVTPNWSQIFGDIYQDGSSGLSINSGIYPYNKKRFRLLHDETIPMNIAAYNNTVPGPTSPTSLAAAVTNQYPVSFYIDLSKKKLQTIYTGTASPVTSSNIQSGALYVAMRALNFGSPNVNIVDLLPTFSTRLRYTDK